MRLSKIGKYIFSALVIPALALAVSQPVEIVYASSTSAQSSTIETLVDGKIGTTTSSNIYHQRFIEEQVTKGIQHYRFERFDTKGWIRGNIMVVDLKDSNVGTGLLYPGSLTRTDTIGRMAAAQGAIAAINGDFFDISGTKAPIGIAVDNGHLLKSSLSSNVSIGVSQSNIGIIANMMLAAEVANPSKPFLLPIKLDGINEHKLMGSQIALYTSLWGPASRASLVKDAGQYVELVIKDNIVTQILQNQQFSGIIPQDTQILLAFGTNAELLQKRFARNDGIHISYTTNPDFQPYKFALSGDVSIVRDGKPISHPSNPHTHPRTAVGFDRTGTKMYILVVDGRQQRSRGMTYDELGIFMTSLGAWDAINLDSGGSTTLVRRPLGQGQVVVANNPSEGSQRAVPNGIGLWSLAAPGTLQGFFVQALDNRVFKDLSRTLQAYPYDEFYNPIEISGSPQWAVEKTNIGTVGASGIFRGNRVGVTNVSVSLQGKMQSHPLQVLDTPVSIYPTRSHIDLSGNSLTTFRIHGKDPDGYESLIEPRDVVLKYDTTLLEILPLADGSYRLQRKQNTLSTIVEITAAGLTTYIGVVSNPDPANPLIVPTPQFAQDPALTNWPAPAASTLRFAVVSGLQPDTFGRSFIHELRAQLHLYYLTTLQPDLVLLNGHFVSKDTAMNYQTAKNYFDTTLGIPYYTIPGRQEGAGNNALKNHTDAFGEDFKQFDNKGTRFLLLNMSRGSIRASSPTQWHKILQALESGKTDPAIQNFVIVAQSPLQLASSLPTTGFDINEVGLLQRLLTDIHEQTGKRTAYISSGSQEFGLSRVNGVIHMDTGFGRQPRSAVFSIDPSAGNKDWIKVKLTP